MIGYITLGTNDIARAATFYDTLLGVIGASRFKDSDSFIAWSIKPGEPALSVIAPFDGQPATVGNGVMVALGVETQAEVIALHDKAMALGMADEGAPGNRGENFYGCYFRDPDGHKLCVFCVDWLTSSDA